jgi:hypothetical protein
VYADRILFSAFVFYTLNTTATVVKRNKGNLAFWLALSGRVLVAGPCRGDNSAVE